MHGEGSFTWPVIIYTFIIYFNNFLKFLNKKQFRMEKVILDRFKMISLMVMGNLNGQIK